MVSEAVRGRPTSVDADGTIVARDVVKTYGQTRAVAGVSFSIRRGELFALLGPNGAGKTTMVEILEGYRRPDSGEVRVLGLDPVREGHELKERMGLMLQQTTLYENIRAGEAVTLFCSYYRNPQRPAELLRLVDLEEARNTPFKGLSGGQKQRLSLALALAGNPEMVFLDEPTAAMDPQARLRTWDIIHELRQQQVTILLTTHYMEEAQRLADRIAIMDHGRIIAEGTPEELTAHTSGDVVSFTAPAGVPLEQFARMPGVSDVREDRPGAYTVVTDDALGFAAALSAWRRERGATVEHLRVSGATLEDVFLRLTGEEVRD